jgi:hypothetical protein
MSVSKLADAVDTVLFKPIGCTKASLRQPLPRVSSVGFEVGLLPPVGFEADVPASGSTARFLALAFLSSA